MEARFSIQGHIFSEQAPVIRDFSLNNRTTGVMSLDLDLDNRIAQYMQLKVFFADEWLLFTEISFTSRKLFAVLFFQTN